MKDSKEIKKKRPLSHIQLLVFPNKSEYIMDNPREYLNGPQRQEKFSLEHLREKWKRKVNVNFKNIDCKFDIKKNRQVLTEYKTEEEERQQKQFFDILHGIHYNGSDYNDENNKSSKSYIIKNRNNKYNKYNDKKSYYLTAKNPWNNSSVFDDRDKKVINKKIMENIKEVKKRNEIINSNNKSYKSLKERFLKNSYLIKEAKKNKFIENETNEYYNKLKFENPGIEKYPEKINALIYKRMINLYQEYSNYIESKKEKKKKNNIRNYKKFLSNTENNLRSKHNFTDIEIFEKLQILLTFLKKNKTNIDQKKFLEPLLLDYNKVIEKEEYLKKINEEYEKYIEEKKKEEEEEKEKNGKLLNASKYPINERTEKEKMINIYSYHKIIKDEPSIVNDKNKQINYFLTAYKNVFDEKNSKKKKKVNPIIITERSTNPYGTFDKMINNNKKEEEIKNNEINNKNKRKRPNSSYGSRQINITYYHPGSYYFFKEENREYYAWSCCLNEDKYSKGCSKKYEKVLNFIYKDDI
jgi:hypothetical protein